MNTFKSCKERKRKRARFWIQTAQKSFLSPPSWFLEQMAHTEAVKSKRIFSRHSSLSTTFYCGLDQFLCFYWGLGQFLCFYCGLDPFLCFYWGLDPFRCFYSGLDPGVSTRFSVFTLLSNHFSFYWSLDLFVFTVVSTRLFLLWPQPVSVFTGVSTRDGHD